MFVFVGWGGYGEASEVKPKNSRISVKGTKANYRGEIRLEGPCKPIDPGIEAAASIFNPTGRHKQKTRPQKIKIIANGEKILELE